MGGSQSSIPPPRVEEDPYPLSQGLTNLSISGAVACGNCDVWLDTRASTSSVRLSRDFGDISSQECGQYQKDLDAVRAKEMSFRDFFTKLQAGGYSRPASQTANGAFCEQVMFDTATAETITTLEQFDANASKLKTIRIRRVTGGGSFSSDTKAKFSLSLPIKAKFVSDVIPGSTSRTELRGWPPAWVTVPGPESKVPVTKDISISSLTLYHPCPVRIENVQADAVLSLNDPSDPNVDVVILVPIRGASMGQESETFFSRIVSQIAGISVPDPVTGLYPAADIATGNNWNIKSVFWLGSPESDGTAKVQDSYYTWDGAATYKREQTYSLPSMTGFQGLIRYGWKPEGKRVRYFMMGTPVNMTQSDLSLLTQYLPTTPADQAIHKIPDPSVAGNAKPLYRAAIGNAAEAGCGVVRERMENPEEDTNSCDPFAMNANKINDGRGLSNRFIDILYNVMMALAALIGIGLALYFVKENYDYKVKNAGVKTGIATGALAKSLLGDSPPPAAAAPANPSASLGGEGMTGLASGLTGKFGGIGNALKMFGNK